MSLKRWLLIIALVLVVPSQALASLTDVYITESSTVTDDGTTCEKAHGRVWFNNSDNWGSGATQIGPGTTIHLCGTIECGDGTIVSMAAQGSGSSGSPITILFETEAKMSAPVCSCWLNLSGQNYITVDGGTNGIIENTDNGTSPAKGNSAFSRAILFNNSSSASYGNYITIKNLTIQGIYVHTQGDSDAGPGAGDPIGIYANGSHISIENVSVTDAWKGISVNFPIDGIDITIKNSTLNKCNWGTEVTTADDNASGFTYSGNSVDGFSAWEGNAVSLHRNGIMLQQDHTLSNVYIYNNKFGPDMNATEAGAGTAAIYFTGSIQTWGTWKNIYIFNNIFLLNSVYTTGWSGGGGAFGVYGNSGSDVSLVANNTMIAAGGGNNGIQIAVPHSAAYNNIVYNLSSANGIAMRVGGMSTSSNVDPRTDATINVDYNIYYAVESSASAAFSVYDYSSGQLVAEYTLEAWKAATALADSGAWDAHSLSSDPLFTNASVTPGIGDYTLKSLSPARGAGKNLSSYITTLNSGDAMSQAAGLALAKDYAGTSRPGGSTAWDVGAYQFAASPETPVVGGLGKWPRR